MVVCWVLISRRRKQAPRQQLPVKVQRRHRQVTRNRTATILAIYSIFKTLCQVHKRNRRRKLGQPQLQLEQMLRRKPLKAIHMRRKTKDTKSKVINQDIINQDTINHHNRDTIRHHSQVRFWDS